MGEIHSEIDKHCCSTILGIFEKETNVGLIFLFWHHSISDDSNLLLWKSYAAENPRNHYVSGISDGKSCFF